MKHFDLAFAFMVSLALHATLFLVFGSYQEARVTFEPGVSAVTLNIVPSVASRAAPGPAAQAPALQPPKPPPEPAPKPVVQPPRPEPKPEPRPQPAVTAPEPQPIPMPPAPGPVPGPVAQTSPPAAQAHAAEPAERPAPAPAAAPVREAANGPDQAAAVNSVDANADLRPHGVTAPASAVGLTQPEYPFYSRRHGEEGTVLVEVEILSTSKPGRIEVVKSSGYSRLDRAAVTALKEAKYVAAQRAGVPITTTRRFAFTFKLEGTETE